MACIIFFAVFSLLFWARHWLSYQGCPSGAPPLGFGLTLVVLTVTSADLKIMFVRFVAMSLVDRGGLLPEEFWDKFAFRTLWNILSAGASVL